MSSDLRDPSKGLLATLKWALKTAVRDELTLYRLLWQRLKPKKDTYTACMKSTLASIRQELTGKDLDADAAICWKYDRNSTLGLETLHSFYPDRSREELWIAIDAAGLRNDLRGRDLDEDALICWLFNSCRSSALEAGPKALRYFYPKHSHEKLRAAVERANVLYAATKCSPDPYREEGWGRRDAIVKDHLTRHAPGFSKEAYGRAAQHLYFVLR